jgi:GGDEF domain-containing protein
MARSTTARTVDELLHHADTALYAAKRRGGNTAVWHH